MAISNSQGDLLKQRFTTVESAWDVFKQGERLMHAAKVFHSFDNSDVTFNIEESRDRERMFSLEKACFLILAKRFVEAYKKDGVPKPVPVLPTSVAELILGLRDMHEHPKDYEFPTKMSIDQLIEEKKSASTSSVLQVLRENLAMHRATVYNKDSQDLSLAGLVSVQEFISYANAFLDSNRDPYQYFNFK